MAEFRYSETKSYVGWILCHRDLVALVSIVVDSAEVDEALEEFQPGDELRGHLEEFGRGQSQVLPNCDMLQRI